ncbi:MAG: hypothetical protein IKX25_06890 [Bacteroidales bacterium]|nr:hypothetical protein [Bacteroidales bacterium]
MKKKYYNPIIRLHDVKANNVIATSDEIPIGDDEPEIPTQAPIRSDSDWSDYNG